MSYMGTVLKNVPEATYSMPENMVELHINEEGLRDDSSPRVEYFTKKISHRKMHRPFLKVKM